MALFLQQQQNSTTGNRQTQEAGQATEEVRIVSPLPSLIPRVRLRDEMEDSSNEGHWIPHSQRRRLRRRSEARDHFLRRRRALRTRGERSSSRVVHARAVNDVTALSSGSDSSAVDLNALSSSSEDEGDESAVHLHQALFPSSDEEDGEDNEESSPASNSLPILPFPPCFDPCGINT